MRGWTNSRRVPNGCCITILATPFSIDTGELTPTMKIKRKVVAQKFAREIDALYAEDAP